MQLPCAHRIFKTKWMCASISNFKITMIIQPTGKTSRVQFLNAGSEADSGIRTLVCPSHGTEPIVCLP